MNFLIIDVFGPARWRAGAFPTRVISPIFPSVTTFRPSVRPSRIRKKIDECLLSKNLLSLE